MLGKQRVTTHRHNKGMNNNTEKIVRQWNGNLKCSKKGDIEL